jgi:hypothetical protein
VWEHGRRHTHSFSFPRNPRLLPLMLFLSNDKNSRPHNSPLVFFPHPFRYLHSPLELRSGLCQVVVFQRHGSFGQLLQRLAHLVRSAFLLGGVYRLTCASWSCIVPNNAFARPNVYIMCRSPTSTVQMCISCVGRLPRPFKCVHHV